MSLDAIDLIGAKFGRLTVVARTSMLRHKYRVWSCLCDCGREYMAPGHTLQNGGTRSCGCLRKERSAKSLSATQLLRPVQTSLCQNCGTKFKHQNAAARFCSKRCYDAAHYLTSPVLTRSCHCGNTFVTTNPRNLYCSSGCRLDKRTPAAAEYRKHYKSARWKELRTRRLCVEPLCRMCRDAGHVTAANIVDHVIPHRGNLLLFFSFENTQSLCKPHHDGAKQREERSGQAIGSDVDGWPLALAVP